MLTSPALSLQGIPAVYFHSLCATPNDQEGFAETGRARTLNRKKWQLAGLESMLAKKQTTGARVFDWYVTTLRKRSSAPAFHPDAAQKILDLGDSIFGLVRSSEDGNQTIVCLYNFLPVSNPVKFEDDHPSWFSSAKAKDLITGGEIGMEIKVWSFAHTKHSGCYHIESVFLRRCPPRGRMVEKWPSGKTSKRSTPLTRWRPDRFRCSQWTAWQRNASGQHPEKLELPCNGKVHTAVTFYP